MKKNVKYKLVLIILCIVFFICLMYFSFNKNVYMSFSFIKDFIYTKVPVSNNKSDIVGTNINMQLKNEVDELKKLLNVESISEFNKINATIISRSDNFWEDKITINKGKKDKIEVGDAVIVGEGLIGKIDSITNNTSIVKLITSNDEYNKVSVKIYNDEKYIYKILETEENNLIIRGIDNKIKIKEDSLVVTSGLSDRFPSGITVGKIKKISTDKYGVSQKVYVESLVDFNNIHFVSILGRVL